MDVLRTVLLIALLLVVVVVVHEMGHFLVAKRSGIQVDEFAVGFGPRLISKRVGETLYSLRVLPAGGFVRLAGMTGLPEERDPGARAFWRASIPKRLATIAAGGIFNLVFAGVLFSILALPGQDMSVTPNSPAAGAGLRSGDRVVAVAGRAIDLSDPQSVTRDLHAVTDASDGRTLAVTYVAPDGSRHTVDVKPYLALANNDRSNPLPSGMVVDTIDGNLVATGDPTALFRNGASVAITGHAPNDPSTTYRGTVSGVTTGAGALGRVQAGWRFGISSPNYDGNSLPYAIARGFSRVPSTIAGTFTGLYEIFTTPNSGGVSGNVQGPVGIVRQTNAAAQAGGWAFLEWMGFLSLNLGLFNLLPIPFLDGGRFVFIGLEGIRRRRVDPRREAAIHYVGLMLILALVVYVTFTGDIGGHA
jgi:regulator of sigma E protease